MPDMPLAQVPSAPAPAKPAAATAKSTEIKSDSEADQQFSNVLKTRMQPDDEAMPAEPEASATTTTATTEGAAVADAEGKPLPQTGNAEDPSLAVLAPLLGDTGTAVEAVETATQAADTVVETSVAVISGVASETVDETPAPAQAAAANGKKPAAVAADAWQPRGPWKVGAAELPESAQNAVAQAVRSAVSESDEGVPLTLTPERFGVEVRAAVAAAHNRAPGVEAALERVSANTTQPATPTVATSAQTLTAQDAVSARSASPTTTVDVPLRQPGWDQALSERVLWVANNKFQGAEIKLNPAHLGPVEVRVQLHNDQAQISFTAQHAATREALEAALPRLREMFSASGYNLVDVNVSQHSFAEQQRHAQGFDGRFQAMARSGDEIESAVGTQPGAGRLTGLSANAIDLFA